MDWKKQIMESGEASVAYNTSTVDVHAACDITTGLLEFTECPKHSAKDIKHSANGSSSVTLGEQHSPKTVTAKPTLPSVFYRALGTDTRQS